MKVIIKEKEFEYVSDYPDGWEYSAGDPFKFPVKIDNYLCFIKRFERKSPEDISGWNLLQKLKGKNEANLVKIYDIVNVQERGKDVYYIFFEFMEGQTLDKLVSQKADINLKRLSTDLFNGIRSLQTNGYWFVDFFEKNIFYGKQGKFQLVDLDSTHPVEEVPENDMYGNKDYWILVFKFYQTILHNTSLRQSDINNIAFNYLQIAFLILRLKLYSEGEAGDDYNKSDFYDKLPAYMDKYAPHIKEVFTSIYQNGNNLPLSNDVAQLQKIIEQNIIALDTSRHEPAMQTPVVKQFSVNKEKVKNGDNIIFSWEVAGADSMAIYKNDALLKQYTAGETSAEIKEVFDAGKNRNYYKLIAYNKNASTNSKIISTVLYSGSVWLKVLKIVGIIIGVLILLWIILIVYIGLKSNHHSQFTFDEAKLYEGSVLTIHGDNKTDMNTISILFNEVPGLSKSVSGNNLTIKVPQIADTSDTNPIVVNVSLVKLGDVLLKSDFSYVKKMVVLKVLPKNITDQVTLIGKNLNDSQLKVFFNNTNAVINSRYYGKLVIKAPDLSVAAVGQKFTLSVKNADSAIFTRSYKVQNQTVNLLDSAVNATWQSGVLSPDGYNYTPESINDLRWQGGESDATGFVRDNQIAMEDGVNYRALRTHPMWTGQGSISGRFRPIHLEGKKAFQAKIGFLHGSQSTDGVIFEVWLFYKFGNADQQRKLVSYRKTSDGKPVDIVSDFPPDVPADFTIQLRVNAGSRSEYDWAAWVQPIVVAKALKTALKFKAIPFGP